MTEPTAEDWKIIKERAAKEEAEGVAKPGQDFGFTWFREDGKGCGEVGARYSRELFLEDLFVSAEFLAELQKVVVERNLSAEEAWEANRNEFPEDHRSWAELKERQRQLLESLATEAREAWPAPQEAL